MNRLIPLLCLVLSSLFTEASEIVAWKVPLSRYGWQGLEAEGVVRRDAAPEASLFFKEGDELWDLTAVKPYNTDRKDLKLDWVVWNATSERLVAKGNWVDICEIHEILEADALPMHLKLTIGIYEVAPDAAPPVGDAAPVSEMSICVESGHRTSAVWEENGRSLDVDTRVWLGETDSFAAVDLNLMAEIPNQPGMIVNTSFNLKAGSPLWVARDFDGKRGMDLCVSGDIESMDGSPIREVVTIQKGEESQSLWPRAISSGYDAFPVEGGGWLMSCNMSPGSLMEFINWTLGESQEDPFADPQNRERIRLPRAASVKPPAVIAKYINHETLDATDWLVKVIEHFDHQLDVKGSFAGYDPIGQRLYFYSDKEEPVVMIGQALSPTCILRSTFVVVTLDGDGQTRLIGKSGCKITLERLEGEETTRRSFNIEPTIGENSDMIDIRIHYQDESDSNRNYDLESSQTLSIGKPLDILSTTGADGKKQSLRLTGEVLRIFPVDD